VTSPSPGKYAHTYITSKSPSEAVFIVFRRDDSVDNDVTMTMKTSNDETTAPPPKSPPSKELLRFAEGIKAQRKVRPKSSPLRDSTKHNSAKSLKSRKSESGIEIISLLEDSDDDNLSSRKEGGVAVSAAVLLLQLLLLLR
jgi:hypothetical protein